MRNKKIKPKNDMSMDMAMMILSIKSVKGEETNSIEENGAEIDKKGIINKKTNFLIKKAVIDTNKSQAFVAMNKGKDSEKRTIKYILERDNNLMIAIIIETEIEKIGSNIIKMREEVEIQGENMKEAKEIIKNNRRGTRKTIDSNIYILILV